MMTCLNALMPGRDSMMHFRRYFLLKIDQDPKAIAISLNLDNIIKIYQKRQINSMLVGFILFQLLPLYQLNKFNIFLILCMKIEWL